MPATAGRVRMPANNQVHSSAALQTHGIWQSAIGYDPYAPANKVSAKESALPDEDGSAAENAYANFQGLLAPRPRHRLRCRNFLSAKNSAVANKDKDADAVQAAAHTAFEHIKKSSGLEPESSEEEEEEESDSSDTDVDPGSLLHDSKPRHKHSRKSRKNKKTRRDRKDDSDDESEGKSDEHERTRKKRAYSENGSESNGSEDLHLRKGKKSSKQWRRNHQRKKRN
ncbi:hypothetical protein B296_00044130 [Ensete ventricosum]|uniref:Uncharacterized protein n=1 Tax=Ensete ventricosum TaxID=4639 RepID=A0A426YLU5_ENSVE|nr:hypothetical protein B296_00044130 [Ensete ventricosum]